MPEEKLTATKKWILGGLGAGAVGLLGYATYVTRQAIKITIDEFVRKECQGVDDDTYKRLADHLWKRGPFSNFPLQFRVEDVQSMRRRCQDAGGVPSTEPIPEPKEVDSVVVESPWAPRTFTEPSKIGLFDRITHWVVDHETPLQKAAVTVGGFALITAGALALFVPGLQPVGVAATAAGAALMVESNPRADFFV